MSYRTHSLSNQINGSPNTVPERSRTAVKGEAWIVLSRNTCRPGLLFLVQTVPSASYMQYLYASTDRLWVKLENLPIFAWDENYFLACVILVSQDKDLDIPPPLLCQWMKDFLVLLTRWFDTMYVPYTTCTKLSQPLLCVCIPFKSHTGLQSLAHACGHLCRCVCFALKGNVIGFCRLHKLGNPDGENALISLSVWKIKISWGLKIPCQCAVWCQESLNQKNLWEWRI